MSPELQRSQHRSRGSRPSSGRRRPLETLFVAGTLLTVAWGTFAFGAVYPWAYTILAIACGLVGIVGFAAGRRPIADARWIFFGLAGAFAVGLIQLIPLTQSTLAALSPATDRFLSSYDLTYVVGAVGNGPNGEPSLVAPRHALSIGPAATVRALALLAGFTLFLAGLTRMMSGALALRVAKGLAFVGVVLALVGVVQKAVLGDHAFAGMKIYGFWKPTYLLTTPFGPYVNKNHFAGWMLMIVPLAFGLLMGAVEESAGAAGRGLRRRLVWLSGPQGGRVLLLIFTILVMMLSLVMTRSRSGLGCFLAVALAAVLFSGRRLGSWKSGASVGLALALFAVAALVWAGGESPVARFTNEPGSIDLRLRIWRVALALARDFPLFGTGLNTFGIATILYEPPNVGLHYQEAHNDYVQILAEGGLVLTLIVALTLFAAARSVRSRFRVPEPRAEIYWLRVGATLGLLAIALQSGVEFSLQMPGNAAVFTLLLALALYRPAQASSL